MADTNVDSAADLDLIEFYRLLIPEHDFESLGKALDREKNSLGDEEFEKQLGDIGSYVDVLNRIVNAHTAQSAFIGEALRRLKDVTKVGESYEKLADPDDATSVGFSLKNKVLQIDKGLGGAEVSGYNARMLILAANRNVKKIYLYNSGFNIVLRGPSLVEVNLVYNRLNEEMGEYGRMLGAMFYMYSDFKIKSILWEFIESLIISSNLNKWDKSNRLRDNVSFLDYQQIILSIGTLMFKDGYEFRHACTEEGCQHVSTEVIDLSLLQLTDFSRLESEQLLQLSKGDVVTPDDVRKFKDSLILEKDFLIGQYRIYQRVPSMSAYLKHGNEFNDELAMSIHDIKDPEIIDQYLKFNYSIIFEPWISKIEVNTADGSAVSFKVADRESVTLILTEIQNSELRDRFVETMEKFIQASNVTNIGHIATPCPNCKAMPSGTINGFVPFDAQNAFFTMLVMRLIQNS